MREISKPKHKVLINLQGKRAKVEERNRKELQNNPETINKMEINT